MKSIAVLFAVIIIFVCVVCGYFISANFSLRTRMQQLDAIKKKEYNLKLIQAKEEASRDFEEKYRADKVSFEAMHKRLEIEKQRNKELKEEFKKMQDKGKDGQGTVL